MKLRNHKSLAILFSCFWFGLSSCSSLKSIKLNNDGIQLINRNLVTKDISGTQLVSLNAQAGSGLAVINDVEFNLGTIELEIRGENNPGQSFVGMAFNIQNDSTYEAIYFRPFNFQSPEEIRREHCMQYISHPEFGWRKLRTELEGQFEAEYINPPDPDDWFAVSLEIEPNTVIVKEKSTGRILMEVDRLTMTESDRIGFWVGHGSKGSFRNLKVKNK